MKDHSSPPAPPKAAVLDETRKVPPGKTRVYHAAAALGRRRMAKMNARELREHQQRASRARWGPKRQVPEDSP